MSIGDNNDVWKQKYGWGLIIIISLQHNPPPKYPKELKVLLSHVDNKTNI